MNFELTKEFLQELSLAVAKRNGNYVVEKIQDLHPADIAEIFDRINLLEAQFIYELLEEEVASDVLVELEEDVRDKFLKSFTAQEIANQVDNMDSDDATDLIQDLSEERKEKVLSKLEDAEQASDIVSLLSYPEDTAGGLMAKEYIKANINWTVEECLEEFRSQAEDVDYVHTIYVVDNQNKLHGTLSLKTFLFAGNNTKISDLYKEEPIYVKTDTPDEDVANIMEKYDLVALPVLNQANILVGRITIDDIVEVIKEAYLDALAGDPTSAFGGVLISNTKIDLATAEEIHKLFCEVVIAPGFDADAEEVLKGKKNRILFLKNRIKK